jgi:hypothetical protein
MNRETARALLRAVCESEESGDTLVIAPGWELTVHAGRHGAPWSLQHVQRVSVTEALITGETRKGQRFAFPVEELRGAAAECAPGDKSSRKTGFM